MAGGPLHLWNEWSIQILVLLSFTLQAFILLFAGMRRRNSRAWRLLLWLAYLFADSTAIYTLGHISNSKSPELRLPAFWAQFLLLHLGGQDTMTAYAFEDNRLWLRHLLTLVLQAMGAAYFLYRHIVGDEWSLIMAAVLIFLVGAVKYGERVWILKSSSHDSIINFLDNARLYMGDEDLPILVQHDDREAYVGNTFDVCLQEAHSLLYICMGQLVDYKIWPSLYQQKIIQSNRGDLFELVEMQLSVMHDVFYTKARVIHTLYGYCCCAVSLLTAVAVLLLFKFKTSKNGHRSADVAVTYTLLAGGIVLEMTSMLRAIGSSWTCAIFQDKKTNPHVSSTWRFAWSNGMHCLHSAVMFFRGLFKSAECGRRWSGSVGQHNLLDLFTMKQDLSSRVARSAGLDKWLNKLRITGTVDISGESKQLVLGEIRRIVEECRGDENMMWSYRGQCALKQWVGFEEDRYVWCIGVDFDESIIAWHLATNLFLFVKMGDPAGSSSSKQVADAIQVLSNYMMFLLVEHPYMLPSPVRARQYDMAYSWLFTAARDAPFVLSTSSRYDCMKLIVERIQQRQSGSPAVLVRGITLITKLFNSPRQLQLGDVLQMILGVWVEMLCYAASHCSRDSHARQLNSGAEFMTMVWILGTTEFNLANFNEPWFLRARSDFFEPRNQ